MGDRGRLLSISPWPWGALASPVRTPLGGGPLAAWGLNAWAVPTGIWMTGVSLTTVHNTHVGQQPVL